MKMGRKASMPAVDSKPRMPLPQPCWKTSTITP